MPIYEYRCDTCGHRFSFLYGVSQHAREPQCPKCQGMQLTRLISRIARIRSEEAMLENLADPAKLGDLDDPRAMARWAKQMGRALGDETGEDFGDMVDEMMETEGQEGSGQDNPDV
jgi:putative FmdB family regulatory protein